MSTPSPAASPNACAALPRGSLVALLTPFNANQSIDKPALRRMVDWHIAQGTVGLVIAGTTGESSTLSHHEHHDLIATAVEYAAGRIHIMAGVGANSTGEAVSLARFAAQAGAHSLLSVVPYYNKPTQRGMVAHFTAQADATALPLVLYNVPGRTMVDMAVDTVVTLAQHPHIAGLKDATGDMARAAAVLEAVPQDFMRYSGDDFTTLPYLALGGHGVISVVANIVPAEVAAVCREMEAGQWLVARERFVKLLPLTRALFAESSPGPAKLAAALQGQCEATLRLPLCGVGEGTEKGVREALALWS
ncbi:4-hydroxy-tetrahydrodipicolinate synthase [Acidovorax sp. SRB_24]|uniref:4-hydroxy-tetrahydrodipicolinate synthase n=1 Tax=Acidovorax sp. SRB_24 TaxID=1962700 RepID=UPI00145F2594|nr:4-hydroxy-tetrahydrodipicolinate synthase [Acidovorax sp. SRB_24]NMM78134.1 4-hydroxy-tetrahydrodipicolinate synthase [Acidovorax sp. SRB_24]